MVRTLRAIEILGQGRLGRAHSALYFLRFADTAHRQYMLRVLHRVPKTHQVNFQIYEVGTGWRAVLQKELVTKSGIISVHDLSR